jgi:chaperonin GroES
MSIRPLHDRVVIRRTEEEATSAGGIVLPGTAAEKPNQGEILAIGPGRVTSNGQLQVMSVKVGDMVLFGQYAGNNTVKIDGEELLIMSESEIYGVLEG